ncbi:ROK family transcriptional regulator [Phycicoccus duodecadis]|uniref:Putative NBD/HSP70 family sugar kinase n=1 Tax=Phycicoccus duodecadis TaxID=173053 RepID=A0A2N3YJD4_9MICO|nr:ROK family transcriptional regulator [Phycicoccus duodecadis]PKW26950.1 putative NBD/HSP70 family sugar kinase [Phycicoccus duodecadis]
MSDTARVANGPHVLRGMNRAALLAALRRAEGAASVSELAALTSLSRPAVTRSVDDLVELGLVERRRSRAEGAPGRPAQRVRFRSELGCVVGVQVGAHEVHAQLADLAGEPRAEVRLATAATAADVLETVLTAVRTLRRSDASATGVWAVGIGSPGVVDVSTGRIRTAPNIPGWSAVPVTERVAAEVGCPVLIDNDVNLAALAERAVGVARGVDTFAFVHWDEQVGAGIVIDGVPYRGATMAAGELGFVDVFRDPAATHDDGPLAPEGSPGAFERRVSTMAVAQVARALAVHDPLVAAELAVAPGGAASGDGSVDALGALLRAGAAGSADAAEAAERVVHWFCAGVSALVLVLDPGTVVLGGRATRVGEPLVGAVAAELARSTLDPPRVLLSQLGGSAVATGAVRLALTAVERRLESTVATA